MVAKRVDSLYVGGRTREWLKIKTLAGQEEMRNGQTRGTYNKSRSRSRFDERFRQRRARPVRWRRLKCRSGTDLATDFNVGQGDTRNGTVEIGAAAGAEGWSEVLSYLASVRLRWVGPFPVRQAKARGA